MSNPCPISALILNRTPGAVGKIGGTEGKALACAWNPWNRWVRRDRLRRRRQALYELSGVYPESEDTFNRFITNYGEQVLPNLDYLVKWRGKDDDQVHRHLGLKSTWLDWSALDAPAPWWPALTGKKLLVVSPFQHSLRKQIGKLGRIWPGGTLPLKETDITLYACPHYPHLVPPTDKDWFAALTRMENDIRSVDYDVMVVGAGASSLPLATFAKSQGKVGIHLGGVTQLMFGIIGGRWRDQNTHLMTKEYARIYCWDGMPKSGVRLPQYGSAN